MTDRTPKVTVVLPAFNAERYLREAIESILSQTLKDLELLIVDDGSTDATRAIVREYDDERVRLVENARNLGLTATLNRALDLARGDYIARQDADDVSEPNRLFEQARWLDRHDSALVGSWFTVIDASGAVVRRTTLPVDDLDLRWAMFFSCPFVHSGVMWRRVPVQQQVGGYDERFAYAQDYDFWRRIAATFRVANLPDYLVRWREHPASMTSTWGERTLEGEQIRDGAVAQALGWINSQLSTPNSQGNFQLPTPNSQGNVQLPTPNSQVGARVRAMSALVRQSQLMDLDPEQAKDAARNLLALHDAMCRQWNVPPAAAKRHRRAVRAAISAGLLRVCRRSLDQGRMRDGRRLLAAAVGVHWPAAARRPAARLAARLLFARRRLNG